MNGMPDHDMRTVGSRTAGAVAPVWWGYRPSSQVFSIRYNIAPKCGTQSNNMLVCFVAPGCSQVFDSVVLKCVL